MSGGPPGELYQLVQELRAPESQPDLCTGRKPVRPLTVDPLMVAGVAPPCWLLIGQETSSGWCGPLQLLPVATIFFLTVGSPVVRLVIVVCYWWVSGENDLFCVGGASLSLPTSGFLTQCMPLSHFLWWQEVESGSFLEKWSGLEELGKNLTGR